MPFEEGQPPLEAGRVIPMGPLVTWAGLAVIFICKSPGKLPSATPTLLTATSSAPAPGQASGMGARG